MSRISIKTIDLTKRFDMQTHQILYRILPQFKKNAKEIVAVDNVNLEIKRGELFGLIGPNGAGKTTLIKMLCTLLLPDYGTANVNNFDIISEQMNVKKSIGALFSMGERGFYWRLSVFRNLEFFAALYDIPKNEKKERIVEVLRLVGLESMMYRPFQKLSGGMKRKLALARALLPDPPILLLDEPTLQLDAYASKHIVDLMRNDLCKKHEKTILYTTHRIEEAGRICDRVAIMHHGRILACETPERIRHMGKDRNIVELKVGKIKQSQLDKLRQMRCVLNLTATLDEENNQYKLVVQFDEMNSLLQVLNYFFNENVRLHDLHRIETTFEEAFIQLTTNWRTNNVQ